MTQEDIERMARRVFREVNGEADEPETIARALRKAFNAGLENAAAEAIRIWKEASNERTNSALTSFRQNALGEGCVESAKAARALKLPE
ncbi:MAG: hypothetical protein KIT32_12025 [Rhodocyclaceae bacterium]|nr:hypothetical protein [Rhodocyclaceae bacterium]